MKTECLCCGNEYTIYILWENVLYCEECEEKMKNREGEEK